MESSSGRSSLGSTASGAAPAKKTVLSDRFTLGEELGRGAYGQVYKGLDTVTGETVAIKQISLSGVSQENLQSVMGEIDLLKTLNHKNIVKYIGSFKTRTHLYIILEYMESGALSSIIKPNKFDVFPEALAAVYIAQVLQGLAYLHEQGVVHRDIKGANILTTKDGLVKLADFGVAAKLGELEEHRNELQQHVVGTPYWMAPEVIEMTQVTAASDIWSVGCLIIELLTGYPPYFDLQPMSALFRIVQDEHPPLPEVVSPAMEDFLLKCFNKDPVLRPNAITLLQHEWVQINRRTLRSSWARSAGFQNTKHGGRAAVDAHEKVASVVSRMLAVDDDDPAGATAGAGAATASGTAAAGADNADAGSFRPDSASSMQSARALATRGNGQTVTSSLASLPLPEERSTVSVQSVSSERAADAADGHSSPSRASDAARNLETAAVAAASTSRSSPVGGRPARGAAGAAQPPPPSPAARASTPVRHKTSDSIEQYPLLSQVDSPGAGSGSHVLPRTTSGATAGGGVVAARAAARGASRAQSAAPSPDVWVERPYNNYYDTDADEDGPLPSTSAAAPPTRAPANSTVHHHDNHHQPSSVNDQDSALSSFLARLNGEPPTPTTPAGAPHATAGYTVGGNQNLMAWLDEGERRASFSDGRMCMTGESFVPRTSRGPSPASTLDASETSFIMESKRKVRDLVRSMRPSAKDANMTPQQACASLTAMFAVNYEARHFFIAEQGVLALLELLELENVKLLEPALELAVAFTQGDTRILESICFTGMVPAIARYSQSPYSPHLRVPAAAFIHQLCFAKDTTLQMFIACRGLKYLVGMLNDNPADPPALTFTSMACIWRVFDTFRVLPLAYVCRILAQHGLVQRLYAILKQLYASSYARNNAGAASWHHVHSPSSAGIPAAWGRDLASPVESERSVATVATVGGERSVSAARALSPAAGQAPRPGEAPPNRSMTPAGEPSPSEWLLDRVTSLMFVLAQSDAIVKSYMCTKDSLQNLLDALQRLQPPHLSRMMKCMCHLSSEASVLPDIKAAGVLGLLVPMLAKEREAAVGPDVQMDALHTLYNICKFDKKVHLEVAATAGVVPHLCRFAAEALVLSPPPPPPATNTQDPAAAVTAAAAAGSAGDPPRDPRRVAFRSHVVPLLMGLVSTSSSTRAKLWASNGLDLFLQMLAEQDSQMQIGIMRALDTWLAEDHNRVEQRLTQPGAVQHFVELLARCSRTRNFQTMPQLLEILQQMIGRSSRLAVALATSGLVPWLLEPLPAAAPILKAKLLDLLGTLYKHYPRPKEFILKYRIQESLKRLLDSDARGEDAVKLKAQELLNAFHINVLL